MDVFNAPDKSLKMKEDNFPSATGNSWVGRGVIGLCRAMKENHLRGRGMLLRAACRLLPELRSYSLEFPGVGCRKVDLSSFSNRFLLEYSWGDLPGAEHLVAALEQAIQPGNTFWDIGANVGVVSLHLSQPRFCLARIDLFEPNPTLRSGLENLFAGVDSVHIHAVGLSNTDEIRQLSVSPGETTCGSVARVLEHAESIPVTLKKGDKFRAEIGAPYPDVIKIDVEGHEIAVMQGLTEIIETHRPIIFFEHIFLSQEEVVGLIPSGYGIEFIGDDGARGRTLADRTKGHDAILIPQEKQKKQATS